MKKVDIWRWIERIVLIGTIIGMLFKYEIKDAVWKAEIKKDLEILKENDEDQENYWENQLKFNTGVNDYFRLNSSGARPSEEEAEGN